jgi:hypothetical protein
MSSHHSLARALLYTRLKSQRIAEIDLASPPKQRPAISFGIKIRSRAKLKNMKTQNRIILGVAAVAVAAIATYAAGVVATKTFRTTGYFIGITQGTNALTGNPQYDNADFAGHNLVNLAMGREANDKTVPTQVMAMTFACDLSSANLVVYDEVASNVVATIASSLTINTVYQEDAKQTGPNRAHFVAVLQIGPNGNTDDGLLSGYFTVAGRLHLDPKTGCPEPVLVSLDRDTLDKSDDDIELPAADDPDTVPLTQRTGLAHLIGVVDMVSNGSTNTVLVPYGGLSIRRQLSIPTTVAPAD